MITYSQVEKLLSARTAEPAVLSLYLQVPMNPPALRGLPAGPANLSRWPEAALMIRGLPGCGMRTGSWPSF